MKKTFVSFLVIVAGLQVSAQFKKGDRMVGVNVASAGYNTGTADVSYPQTRGYESKLTSYNFSATPLMGWFISDQTVVGGTILLNPFGKKDRYSDMGTTFQEDKSSSFNIGLGAFARHYFESGSSFVPYGQFGFNFGINSTHNEGFRYYDATIDYRQAYDGKSSGAFFANAQLQAGMTKMLGENAGLDVFAGYTFSYNKNTFKTTTTIDYGPNGSIDQTNVSEPTTKFTGHGFVIGLGFQVFLRKKK